MIKGILRKSKNQLASAYALTVSGYVAEQLYPLMIGFAINDALEKNYSAILWLCLFHFVMLSLRVSAKMMDTRVFTRIHSHFASDAIAEAHRRGVPPSLIAGRAMLLREYITFLERDVPAALLSVISLVVATVALFWLDPLIGAACLVLLVPSTLVNGRLAIKSQGLNEGLNDRLEKEVRLLQDNTPEKVLRHYKAISMWRIKISDLEAQSFGFLELFVIALFGLALWRVALQDEVEAGTIYAVLAYVLHFVISMDQVPQIVQQFAKLTDITRRLNNA